MISKVEPYSNGAHRLAELGLDLPSLTDVLLYGSAERSTYTRFDARGASGTALWSRNARRLSEIFVPKGWERIDPDGQPTIVHPSGRHAVIAANGNEVTGQTWDNLSPSTKNPRGKTFELAINDNLALFDIEAGPDLSKIRETWILLSYIDPRGRIYSEVSLPLSMKGNHISDWHTRLILPTIDPGAVELNSGRDEDQPPSYDFAVTRK